MNNYDTSGGIDRSIGVLFIGIAVTAFILLTVIGMGRVQSNAEEATRGERNAVSRVQTELGG